MRRQLTTAAVKDYTEAPPAVQKAFDKQVKLLVENFRHPSLRRVFLGDPLFGGRRAGMQCGCQLDCDGGRRAVISYPV